MRKKIIWLVSTGFLALLPFVIKGIMELLVSRPIALKEYISKGDLYAITTTICLGCIIDVLLNKEQDETLSLRKGFYTLALVAIGFLSSLIYGAEVLINNDTFKGVFPNINMNFIVVSQLAFYMGALVIGTLSRQFT